MFSCEWCRANHVLPCRPSGLTLDIKKSSHKKLSKWLQSKASTGMVSFLTNIPCFMVFFFCLISYFDITGVVVDV